MRRTLAIDVLVCTTCGGRLELVSVITFSNGRGGLPVPLADEATNRVLELAFTREARELQRLAREDADADLDRVHPRRVLRRVHEVEPVPVTFVEARPALPAYLID